MLSLSRACYSLITILSLNSANLFASALPQPMKLSAQAAAAVPDYRADIIKSAFKHAWRGYTKYAYGHDELLSDSNSFSDSR